MGIIIGQVHTWDNEDMEKVIRYPSNKWKINLCPRSFTPKVNKIDFLA